MQCECKAKCEKKEPIRVAITGAAGQIGYAIQFRIANGEMFGCDQPVIIQMLEYNAPGPLGAAEGVKMELIDCGYPLLEDVTVSGDPMEAFKDADYVVMIGGIPRKDGMTRADLLSVNGGLFKTQGEAIDKVAKKTVKVFVVANPANTNCLICSEHAKSIPRENFMAMTALDHNRILGQISQKLGISTRYIHNTYILGNHSSSMVPVTENGYIECPCTGEHVSIRDALKKKCEMTDAQVDEYLVEFEKIVKERGAAIIKARGASSAGSAAKSAIDSVRRWHLGTKEGEIFSASILSCTTDNAYGVEPGVCFSFPVTIKDGKVSVVKFEHSEATKKGIEATKAELFNERKMAGLE